MLRALPFLIFKGNKILPKSVQTLGRTLPSAIMAVLIVYCLKDAREDFMGTGVWQLLAVFVVAVSYKWKHNTFLSILLGTISYMFFCGFSSDCWRQDHFLKMSLDTYKTLF